MRIIAGLARGRRLLAPKGRATRPTPERVREALFSILADRVTGAEVLDLFAGTGALGLEALSRGARRTVLVEQARPALAVLERNVATVNLPGAEVWPVPAERALARLRAAGRRFDLVFLDPPYALGLLTPSLAALGAGNLLLPRATVVCEHPTREPLTEVSAALVRRETRAFGDVSLSFFETGIAP